MAAGQSLTGTACTLPALKTVGGGPDWDSIETLVEQWKPDAFVVGLPVNMDGTESDMSRRARRFARRLEGRFERPCHTIDERLSTREARNISRDNAARRGARHDPRRPVDSLAAQLILESWLAENG